MGSETSMSLVQIASPDAPLSMDGLRLGWTAWLRTGWTVSKILLAGLLVTYFLAWGQDLQRLRSLEAEPSPPFKVITKYEVWERVQTLMNTR